MLVIKSFVAAAVSLALFDSLSLAGQIPLMSFQERMKQSDVVVVGRILKVGKSPKKTGTGSGRWFASCRVERFILEKKTSRGDVEGAKSVSLITIGFSQVPLQVPAPLALSEGKRYLLFLRNVQPEGAEFSPPPYEMITPYHGAFEAGEDYFVHDEQSPEYPQAVKMSFEEIVRRVTPQNPAPQQPDRELSEDELRMKERLIALSRGEGAVADLRIELSDGGMESGRFYRLAYGQIVGQEWDTPGSSLKRHNMFVTDEEVRKLLRQLIEHEYWTFRGTQFIPDAKEFGFRFQYKALQPIKYSCQVHEYEPSAQLSAIRSVWLSFVSGVPSQDQASCEAQGGRWGRFGLMEKEQCNRPTTDAGKACFDHSECESDCVTEDPVPAGTEVTGKCFEWTVMLGRCLNGVKDGKVGG